VSYYFQVVARSGVDESRICLSGVIYSNFPSVINEVAFYFANSSMDKKNLYIYIYKINIVEFDRIVEKVCCNNKQGSIDP